jgi:hypothetical protein
MAKSPNITTKIVENGIERNMTNEEFESYKKVTQEASVLIQSEKDATVAKEIAIAKLVALGLTESDLRAVKF